MPKELNMKTILSPKNQILPVLAVLICLFFAISYGNTAESHRVSGNIEVDRVIIKFHDEDKVRFKNGSLVSNSADLNTIQNLIQAKSGKSIKPLFVRDQEAIDNERTLLEAEKSLSLPDLNSYYQVEIADYNTAKRLINELNDNPLIENVYIRPKSYPAEDIPPTTPDFMAEQGYLYSAPDGVGADYAWNVPGGKGENVHVIDIEGNWNFDHEDFGENIDTLLFGLPVNAPGWASHGSCVMGIIGADSNAYGITGIAHEAEVSGVSVGGIGTATAVDFAAAYLSAGDVILIELNSPGPRYDFEYQPDQAGYVPEEYFDETFDAVQLASAKGIIVVAVAGNGAENLDDPIYEDKFNTSFRNSHAIIVGAGAPPSGNWGQDRSRLYYSNYGSRINLQGWGKEVAASGYGVLFDGDGDYKQHYTDRFGGTSAAGAMVTGVVASLQSAYIETYGEPMAADDLANLLDLSGTLQPNPSENIGPRPDLELALQSMAPPGNVKTSPQFVQYAMTDGQTGQTSIFLLNDYNDRSIDYTITFDDTIEGWTTGGWLDISPQSGSIAPLGGDIIYFYFDGTVIPGSVAPYKAEAEIEVDLNSGWDTIFVPIFLDLECNDTNYAVYDSDQGTIDYDWIDITQTGTQIQESEFENSEVPANALDDGTAGPYELGFTLNFYNDYFNEVNISTNGGVSFVEEDITINGYYDDIYFPSPGFDAFLSPFWNDLTLDQDYHGNGAVYYYQSPANDTFIVSYERVGNLIQEADTTITFQIILTADGNIRYQYKDIGIGGAAVTSLVGLSLDQDCSYHKFYDRFQSTQNMPHDSFAIEFRPNFEFTFLIGDSNNDGTINISDAVHIINYVFISGDPPLPYFAGDSNCDGSVNVSDAVWIINYVFLGGYVPGDIDGDGLPDC
ncbi:MAG: S8 family serine peptidase [candidate division Zixibacteria bacterium]|nr:S8 family serine peptidase [candidate division Zixibacteria bacterium]